MRTFAALTLGGVAGVVLFKLLAALLFPILGMLMGLLMTGIKLVLIAAAIYFVYSLFFKRKKERNEV